jgi:hypothetical protein
MKLIPRLNQKEILLCVLMIAKKIVQEQDVFETSAVLFWYVTQISS